MRFDSMINEIFESEVRPIMTTHDIADAYDRGDLIGQLTKEA